MTGKGVQRMKQTFRVVLLLLVVAATMATPGWGIEDGAPLPEFTLRTFDGRVYSHASLVGTPTLVIFWNTWCAVCRKELPEVNRLVQKLGPEKLTVIAVNTAFNDSDRKALAYWNKSGFVFPTSYDYYFEVGEAFGIRGVPTIFLIDVNGIVQSKHAELPQDLEERIKRLQG